MQMQLQRQCNFSLDEILEKQDLFERERTHLEQKLKSYQVALKSFRKKKRQFQNCFKNPTYIYTYEFDTTQLQLQHNSPAETLLLCDDENGLTSSAPQDSPNVCINLFPEDDHSVHSSQNNPNDNSHTHTNNNSHRNNNGDMNRPNVTNNNHTNNNHTTNNQNNNNQNNNHRPNNNTDNQDYDQTRNDDNAQHIQMDSLSTLESSCPNPALGSFQFSASSAFASSYAGASQALPCDSLITTPVPSQDGPVSTRKNVVKQNLQHLRNFLKESSDSSLQFFDNQVSQHLEWLEEEIENAATFQFFLQKHNVDIDQSNLGYFSVCPTEIMLLIFSYLPATDLAHCQHVCRAWNKLAAEDTLYKSMCLTNGFYVYQPKPWLWIHKSQSVVFGSPTKNGPGTFYYDDVSKYCGDWLNDRRHGHGFQVFNDGSIYAGQWKQDKRDGFGKMCWANPQPHLHETLYLGQWQSDAKHGIGFQQWLDGSQYLGNWVFDKREGVGKMTWTDGQSYCGHWTNSRKEGVGTEIWADGRQYIGQYRNSNMHGFGLYIWPSGDKYVGQWEDDCMHGFGTYFWPNGTIYEGEWERDSHSGNGIYHCPGEQYIGQWKNNRRDGIGREKTQSGLIYEGEWSQNQKNGNGKLTWPNGDFLLGYWVQGTRQNTCVLVVEGMTYVGDHVSLETQKDLSHARCVGAWHLYDKPNITAAEIIVQAKRRVTDENLEADMQVHPKKSKKEPKQQVEKKKKN